MESLVSLANSLTSPAKLALGAYVVILWIEATHGGAFHVHRGEFLTVVLVFAALQIGHDDWLRIVLNRHADRKDSEKRRALGLLNES